MRIKDIGCQYYGEPEGGDLGRRLGVDNYTRTENRRIASLQIIELSPHKKSTTTLESFSESIRYFVPRYLNKRAVQINSIVKTIEFRNACTTEPQEWFAEGERASFQLVVCLSESRFRLKR